MYLQEKGVCQLFKKSIHQMMAFFAWVIIVIGLLPNQSSAQVQPSIMVIPYTKTNEDIRTILEEDINRRIAVTKVKELFDKKGYTTVDFVAKLKAANDDHLFTTNSPTDIKSLLIESAGADVHVEIEVAPINRTPSGNSARIILTAYLSSNGISLVNKVCESAKFYVDDYAALITRALGNFADGASDIPCTQEFMQTVDIKFKEIYDKGMPIKMNIVLAPTTKTKFSTEIKPDNLPLSDLIENWVGDNAQKNYYHIQGNTELRIIYDEVRIPMKENGRNNTPARFATKLYQFLRGKGVALTKDTKNGTVIITIN